MKAFLAEYASLAGDPEVAAEGAAMRELQRVRSDRVRGPDAGIGRPRRGSGGSLRARRGAEWIAPDHLLAGFTRTLEGACHNVGCGAMNVAVAANKQRSSAIRHSHVRYGRMD